MSLFDIFKKKPKEESETTDLEELLKKAAVDGSFRVAFYKKLLVSELIVLTEGNDIPEGRQTLEQDTSLKVLSLSDGRIPVFTSTDRIFDKKVICEQVQYVAMKGSDLFNVVRGATLILNPYSDYGKELLPDEIASLLDGSIFSSAGETITVSEQTEVLLGQPAKRPNAMLEGLKTLFDQRGRCVGVLSRLDRLRRKDRRSSALHLRHRDR